MGATVKVVVVGGGPAALACVHRLRTAPGVAVTLVTPDGMSNHLPGVGPVVTSDADAAQYRSPILIDGVEMIPAPADTVEPGAVTVAGRRVVADAVVVAAGLETVPIGGVGPGIVGFWDLQSAAAAAPVVSGFDDGVIGVVIGGPLYRCPPAPYGLAIRLARRAARLGRDIRVCLTTPEPQPLAAIGSTVTTMLVESCAAANVEIHYGIQPDPDALAAGSLVAVDLPSIDLAAVVPPHQTHRLLRDLSTGHPLVTADAFGRSEASGIYVAGDAVASPFPRAAAPAMVSGVAAAEGVLIDSGILDEATAVALPEPDCFVDQGDGRYSRIQISYPDGAPPVGSPAVTLTEAAPAAEVGFDAAVARWRTLCLDNSP